jgi:hypothetical protein
MPRAAAAEAAEAAWSPEVERLVREAIRAIRFGTVEITIHDSQVVQIERTEKLRLNGAARK